MAFPVPYAAVWQFCNGESADVTELRRRLWVAIRRHGEFVHNEEQLAGEAVPGHEKRDQVSHYVMAVGETKVVDEFLVGVVVRMVEQFGVTSYAGVTDAKLTDAVIYEWDIRADCEPAATGGVNAVLTLYHGIGEQ